MQGLSEPTTVQTKPQIRSNISRKNYTQGNFQTNQRSPSTYQSPPQVIPPKPRQSPEQSQKPTPLFSHTFATNQPPCCFYSQFEDKKNEQLDLCANKFCKNYVQGNSAEEVRLETLCVKCRVQYQMQQYCLYCKQIYFDQTDDGKEWIMCEGCQRWLHSSCASFNTKQNPNAVFKCIKCKKVDFQQPKKTNPRNGYVKMERKKNNDFLTTLGFEWELTQQELNQDLRAIAQCLNNS